LKDKTVNTNQLADHFFRHSYVKMVAVLVRYFGLKQVETAEDIIQDTLVEAMEKWSVSSIPDHPEAWLMDVAKKKTINLLRRNQTFQLKVSPNLQDELLFNNEIEQDSALRMIFACCHPALPTESQIALALKTLCGLSVAEIADGLLTNEATINKRLYRARKRFREGIIRFDLPQNHEQPERLDNVFTILYLLFNEGYYSSHHRNTIRMDFCFEAIRLLKQILESFPDSAKGRGLLSLMLLSVARFESRLDDNGALIILAEQDRSLWDKNLISEGINLLHQTATGKNINTYQLQAGIAAEHCLARSFEATNWESIYRQYIILDKLAHNEVVRFNKCIAQFYAHKKEEALSAILLLENEPSLNANPHFYIAVGVFYAELQLSKKAISYFETALQLSRSKKEKKLIVKLIGENYRSST